MKLSTGQKTVNTSHKARQLGPVSVPYAHVALLTDFAIKNKINMQPLLSEQGFSEDRFHLPDAKVPARKYTELLLAVDKAAADPSLWFRFGKLFSFPAIGELGMLLATSKNAREALPLLCKYYAIVSCGTELHYELNTDAYVILLKEALPNDRESRLKTELLASIFSHNVNLLINVDTPIIRYNFDFSEPENTDLYKKELGHNISFSNEQCRFIIPEKFLDTNFTLANDTIKSVAARQCQQALDKLKVNQPFTTLVRKAIIMTPGLNPTKEEVASVLAVSSRTLARRLSEQNTGFEEIKKSVQYQRAQDLLLETKLTINEISYLVGFDNPSNFTRAFQKWSNVSPSTFRKETRS